MNIELAKENIKTMKTDARIDQEEYNILLEKFQNICVKCSDKPCKRFQEKRINQMYHELFDCILPPCKE